MKKNILVIGLGSMGKRRIRLMKMIDSSINIYGVDGKNERCIETNKLFGIETFSSIEGAVNNVNVNCAFVCTAPLSHGSIIHECLENNWDVFTEINLVNDLYKENIKMAKEKSRILFLSSTPLYRNEMRYIKHLINSNEKKINYFYHIGQYLPDWHPWENFKDFFVSDKKTNGCREIFAIELPWMVQAFGKIVDIHVMKQKLSTLNIDYNDTYTVQILHENGSMGTLMVDTVCRQAIRHLEIFNEDVFLTWEGTPQSLEQFDFETKKMKVICEEDYIHEKEYSAFINEYAYIKEIEEFFSVLDGKEMIYDFEEDQKILELIDRIEA